ncbi:MAG: DUF4382 domain-containing protein [Thaumarchaeota archaeon]|nr:DUF4382 domain-containing protein [Nitrososphaerota archaeon]
MAVKRQSLKYGVAAVVIAIAIIGAALFTYNLPSGPNMNSTNPSQPSSSLSSSSSESIGSSQSTSFGTATQTSPSASSSGTTSTQTSAAILGGSGILNIYLTDAPPSEQTLKYLLVNVSSVELRYEGNIATTTSSSTTSTSTSATSTGTTITSPGIAPANVYIFTVPTDVGMNINLTSLSGQQILLGAPTVPAGDITSIVLRITDAKAFFTDGMSAQLKVVANGKLMIPIHFSVQPNGPTDLTIDIIPNDIHISQGKANVLTPVIHTTVVERGQGSTTTHTTEVTQTTSTSETTEVTTTTTTTSTSQSTTS